MGGSSKFPKSWSFWKSNLKTCSMPININNFKFKWSVLSLDKLKLNQRSHNNLPNSGFWGWLSVESQPQNPEFRINPESFHPFYCFDWLTELRLKVPVNIISVMLGLLPGREEDRKEEWNRRKGPQPPPKFASSEANFILPTGQIWQGHLPKSCSRERTTHNGWLQLF